MDRKKKEFLKFSLALIASFLANTPAQAGCREDAIEAAKACMSEDLEAGMQGSDSEEAKRILGELAVTGEMILSGTIVRQGDLYKKLAVQSKRGSLLAIMKSQACKKAHESCSSSCAKDDQEPQAQQAASLCQRIGSKNANLAEEQASLMLANMKTNEIGQKSTATLVEHQEGRTGGSECDDKYSASECTGQKLGPMESAAQLRSAEQQFAMNGKVHDGMSDTSSISDTSATGEEFHFDGRFETISGASEASLETGRSIRSLASETGSGTGSTYSGSRTSTAWPTGAEVVDDSEIGSADGSAKSSRFKKALKVIKGLVAGVAAGIGIPIGNQSDDANHGTAVKKRAKLKRIANRIADDSQLLIKADGVTSATGPSLFEKIHRQYKTQENNLVPE
jgi:hypothetical protein